jgi:hypothetical protein
MILYIIGVLAFAFIFPIWAALFARKRGLNGLAILSIVSIFLLLGPIGGLIALLGSVQRPLLSQFKPFCNGCGAEKVKAYFDYKARESGENLDPPLKVWMYFIFYILMAGMLFMVAWGLHTEFLEWAGLTGTGPAIIFTLGGLGMLWSGISKTVRYYQLDRERLIKLSCRGCGQTRFLREDGTVLLDSAQP